MIKNILAFFGAIFLLLILVGCYLFGCWQSLDHTGRAFTQESIPAVFTSTNFDELKKRADPRLFGDKDDAQAKAAFDNFSKLGKYESLQDCAGRPAINIGSPLPPVTAQYSCKVKFENDTPVITFALVGNVPHILSLDARNSWKIIALNVTSDYLVKASNGQ